MSYMKLATLLLGLSLLAGCSYREAVIGPREYLGTVERVDYVTEYTAGKSASVTVSGRSYLISEHGPNVINEIVVGSKVWIALAESKIGSQRVFLVQRTPDSESSRVYFLN